MPTNDHSIVKLRNVRLSFPALFTPRAFSSSGGEAEGKPKFSAAFILDKKKNAAEIVAIKKATDAVAKEKWPKGVPGSVKRCLHDGGEKDHVDGYGDHVMYITASSQKRVPLVLGDLTPTNEEDGKLYAGCYVNASIRLWAQDNKWGKRINAQLRVVQVHKDGEAFGEKAVDPEEELGASSEGESSDDSNDLL